jgi:2-polyprenyl-6-methoxyphenol hydroxylase-like FAD-dependent oxidoreductase
MRAHALGQRASRGATDPLPHLPSLGRPNHVTLSNTTPGNGLNALHAIDPDLGATIEGGLLPDGPFVQFSADDPEKVNVSFPSAAGIWAGLSRNTGHYPWSRIVAECAARLPAGVLRLDHSFDGYEEDATGLTVRTRSRATGTPHPPLRAAVLVGADGNQSGVRAQLLGDGPPTYTGLAVWRGQCPVPAGWPHGDKLLTGWGKGKFITLVVKLGGVRGDGDNGGNGVESSPTGVLAWQCFAPWPETRLGELASTRVTDPDATARADEAKRARCLEAHAGFPAIVLDLIRATPADRITEHPQGFREPDTCGVWGRGRVTLVGDAAHLATPFLGQGTGQALEDAVALARALGEHGATETALRAYEAFRIPQASAVQAGSVGLAKAVAGGGRATEREWYGAHPEVLARSPEPLVK